MNNQAVTHFNKPVRICSKLRIVGHQNNGLLELAIQFLEHLKNRFRIL